MTATDRRNIVPIARPLVRSASDKNEEMDVELRYSYVTYILTYLYLLHTIATSSVSVRFDN